MMWPVHACRQSRKSLFIHIILGSMWGTSGTLLLYFATNESHYREATLILYLKKHALQGDTKVGV